MKTATLVAIISMAAQAVTWIFYTLMGYEVLKYNKGLYNAINIVGLLSSIGLIIFFIQLYDRESRRSS